MRRKELMARALAAGLAAVQVGGSVGQVVYAAEAIVEEEGITAEAEESSEAKEPTEAEESGEEDGVTEGESEESSEAEEPTEGEESSEAEESTEPEGGTEPSTGGIEAEESAEAESTEADTEAEATEPSTEDIEDEEPTEGTESESEAESKEPESEVTEPSIESEEPESTEPSTEGIEAEATEPSTEAQDEGISKKPMKVPQKAPAKAEETVVITVVDVILDDEGNELTRETRTEDEVDKGTEYSYSALSDESLTVIGKSGYSGTAEEDITIEFRYHLEEQIMLAADFTVTFDTDGGDSIASQTVAGGTSVTDPGIPTKAGYKFLYWSRYKTGGSAVDISSFKITEDTTFYAYWREAEHTVTFNYNMAGTPDLEVQVEDDTAPDEPARPTRDGYIFTGWTTSKSSAERENYEHFDWKADTKITKDTTYYAKWVPAVSITITDHFYDLEGNEVAVIPRDTVKMCKGAYFSNSLGNDWWHDGLNKYCGGASLTGYCSATSDWEWIHQYAKAGTLDSDYDVSQLVVDDPAEIEHAYEHFKRETVFYDVSGNASTGIETDQRAITNGQKSTSGHATDHYAYGDNTIDYYYREIPQYTYEVIDHYGDMVDGNFVEDHQQSRGKESFRSFYLQYLNKMKVPVNPEGVYTSLAQIKYHGYKVDSQGIENTVWGAVVTDKAALTAVDETLTGSDVIVKDGVLGSDSDYGTYCVGDTTIDLYYVNSQWGVTVTDEVYGVDGKLISSTPRQAEYFTKGDRVVMNALTEPGYSVFSIESTSGDALDSANLDGGQAVINSLNQNTAVTFKYTAYPADNTLQVVEVIKNKSGRELSRTEKPIVSYDTPTKYVYTPPTGCSFSRLVKGVYKYPSGEADAGLTYEGMTGSGFNVAGHMYVELEFVKDIKITVNKHKLDSTGKEVGVQTDTADYGGTILPDATYDNLPLVKYSYTYTPVGGAETTVEVTDISNLVGIPLESAGDVTLDAYYQETSAKKYTIKVIDETYAPDGTTLIQRTEREVKEVPENGSYTVSAQTPDGYYNLGKDTVTGTATEDGEVVFKYAKYISITVRDVYHDSGFTKVLEETTREPLLKKLNESYTVRAKSRDGYDICDNAGAWVMQTYYSGSASKDIEIVIHYRKRAEVKVVHEYYAEDKSTLLGTVTTDPIYISMVNGYPKYTPVANTTYNNELYSVMNPEVVKETGIAGDTTITIKYYRDDPRPKHTVTIIDKYYEPDGVTPIEEVKRPVETYPEGSSPVIKPDPKPGFDPKDEDKTIPNISEDTEVIFEYVKRVTVNVIDEYYAEDGSTLVDSVTRPVETYKPGTGYNIMPEPVHGGKTHTVMNPEVLSGTATSDVTIRIKYRCDEAQKKLFKIAVYDEYYGTNGTTLIERVLRSNNEYMEGSSQTFSAAGKSGYSVFDPASGTIKVENLGADTEVVFKYKKNKSTSGGNGGGGSKPVNPPSGGGGGGSDPDPKPVTPPVEPITPPVTPPENPPVEPVPPQPIEEAEKEPVPSIPVKKEFTITVVDKCFDRNGTALISYDRRLVETLEEGSEYSYSALDLDGFKVKGVTTHEGTVHGNLILEFTYVREAQHTITVVDKYVSTDKIPYTPEHPEEIIASSTYTDTEGGTTYTVLVTVRQVDTLPEGSSYEYHAKKPSGFVVSGPEVLKGTVGDDLVLEFTYVIDGVGDLPDDVKKPVDKDVVKPQKVLITVVDKYISEKPISNGEDTVVEEVIKGKDGRTYVVTGSVRVVEAFVDGDGYEYKALDLDGFKVKGSRVARGKATEDKTVEFVYTTIEDTQVPAGVFDHKMSYAKKTADDDIKTFIPHADEPKTGESIPVTSTGFMMLALAFIEYLKKKFRR